MSVNTKMTAIANEIRELSGTAETMGLDIMASHVHEANIEVSSQSNLITQIATALQGKAIEGGGQATPVITVGADGLITATAGIKNSTYQLAFQPAKTITPNTTSQIAVSSGYYTGGNITVAGDSNLVAGNIKSGVSIFGVSGTLEEGSVSGVETLEISWAYSGFGGQWTGTIYYTDNLCQPRTMQVDALTMTTPSIMIAKGTPVIFSGDRPNIDTFNGNNAYEMDIIAVSIDGLQVENGDGILICYFTESGIAAMSNSTDFYD